MRYYGVFVVWLDVLVTNIIEHSFPFLVEYYQRALISLE